MNDMELLQIGSQAGQHEMKQQIINLLAELAGFSEDDTETAIIREVMLHISENALPTPGFERVQQKVQQVIAAAELDAAAANTRRGKPMTETTPTPLFPLGRIVATPGALALGLDFSRYLGMHQRGYWGDVDQEDWQENDLSVKQGYRILSAYETPGGKIWILTEADRSVTTVLLPDEY